MEIDTLPYDEPVYTPMTAGAEAGDGVEARYEETPTERRLVYEDDDTRVVIAQNRDGYAMLMVREGQPETELERYYALDMALDHVAAVLGVRPSALPVPDEGESMGM